MSGRETEDRAAFQVPSRRWLPAGRAGLGPVAQEWVLDSSAPQGGAQGGHSALPGPLLTGSSLRLLGRPLVLEHHVGDEQSWNTQSAGPGRRGLRAAGRDNPHPGPAPTHHPPGRLLSPSVLHHARTHARAHAHSKSTTRAAATRPSATCPPSHHPNHPLEPLFTPRPVLASGHSPLPREALREPREMRGARILRQACRRPREGRGVSAGMTGVRAGKGGRRHHGTGTRS